MSIEYSFLSELGKQELLVAGVDEVGRGALFGPVVAAVVVVPISQLPKFREIGVRDSKKISPKKREQLVEPIKAIASGSHVGSSSVDEIDQINILQASLLAMRRAVLAVQPIPELCLVDGKFAIPDLSLPQRAIIKGDSQSLAIAAASILAKVWRDNLIIELAQKYPEYDLASNKGYPTKKHRLAIKQYGVLPEHRKSFSLK